MSFNDVSIDTVERNDCRIHFWGMNKSEVINRMKNAGLSKKRDNYDYEKNCFIYSDAK